ncbi:hypothetical protein LshimejAT787_0300080 [Lyophyllum shimeji]|uniref:Uncharacterized protein n=1 Tax=Lyophyllum shimeji TaxID=47721 RepID=A0A9P3PGV2_LYOSH|nr:hypothetical protein LshimejAT787_0300080 [Lyophyllum shimeji]
MLARLANLKAALCEWEVRFETACDPVSIPNDSNSLIVDLDALRALILPNDAFARTTGQCGRTIAPVYNCMQNMIKSDVEHVVQVLSDLEDSAEVEEWDVLNRAADIPSIRSCPLDPEATIFQDEASHQQRDCTGRSCSNVEFQTKIPKIIITPCEPHAQHSPCHVPLQNSAFGNQLTVPSHPLDLAVRTLARDFAFSSWAGDKRFILKGSDSEAKTAPQLPVTEP